MGQKLFQTVLEMTEIWNGYKQKREVDTLFSLVPSITVQFFLTEMGTEGVGQGFVILQSSFAVTEHF